MNWMEVRLYYECGQSEGVHQDMDEYHISGLYSCYHASEDLCGIDRQHKHEVIGRDPKLSYNRLIVNGRSQRRILRSERPALKAPISS